MGKTFGFPTANLDCRLGNIFEGVYACRVFLHNHPFNGVAIFRYRERPEAHLLDWQGELKGEEIEVEILDKISETRKFSDQAELVSKIKDDVRKAREWFATIKSPS